jgi:tRNA A-37 threonylcarbamoyl transferase component Bud32
MPYSSPEELAPHFPQLEIIECLGRGGMGVVYKARQKSLNRLVALKLLAPERVADAKFAQRFTHEAHALAALSHPNIVTIHDFGQAGGFYFLLMEFVDGVNLRQAIKAGRFSPEQALAVVPPVCEALQYAHEHGIVHRDIKPENLLLDKVGRIKIADFGIAKILGGDGELLSPDKTQSDTAENEGMWASAAGTPQYMAPEQKDHRRTDHRADIYSLGVVLYELLTGELPAEKVQAPSSRLRGVQIDVRLDEIVLRALEKMPELRYQTAGEFRTQLKTVMTNPSKASSPEPTNAVADPVRPAAPRFSRLAIVGACWAPLFVATFFLFFSVEAVPAGQAPKGPNWIQMLAIVTLLPLGFLAPFGTTILGWIAIARIRRSAGRIYGLGLAVFDALLYPLLVLTGLVGWFWWWVFRELLHPQAIDGLQMDGAEVTVSALESFVFLHSTALIVLCTFLTAGSLSFAIVRRLWQVVSVSDGSPVHPRAAAHPLNLRFVWRGPRLGIAVLILSGTIAVLWVIFRDNRPPTRASSSPISWVFGPVVERILPFDRGFIDFQSGSILHPEWKTPPLAPDEWESWTLRTGVDAAVEENPIVPISDRSGFPRLVSLLRNRADDPESCVFVAEEANDFDSLRPSDADTRLKMVTERNLYWGLASGSRPWWFKTRDGAKGVLQILGTFDSPRGLKIRYKLLVPDNGAMQPGRVGGGNTSSDPSIERSASTPGLLAGAPFGPVVERVLETPEANSLASVWLDLDSGANVSIAAFTGDKDEPGAFAGWLRKRGADVCAGGWSTFPSTEEAGNRATTGERTAREGLATINGLGLLTMAVRPELWNSTDVNRIAALDTALVSLADSNQYRELLPEEQTLANPEGKLPATFAFKTAENKMGLLQIVDFLDSPRGVKFRYKLLIP